MSHNTLFARNEAGKVRIYTDPAGNRPAKVFPLQHVDLQPHVTAEVITLGGHAWRINWIADL